MSPKNKQFSRKTGDLKPELAHIGRILQAEEKIADWLLVGRGSRQVSFSLSGDELHSIYRAPTDKSAQSLHLLAFTKTGERIQKTWSGVWPGEPARLRRELLEQAYPQETIFALPAKGQKKPRLFPVYSPALVKRAFRNPAAILDLLDELWQGLSPLSPDLELEAQVVDTRHEFLSARGFSSGFSSSLFSLRGRIFHSHSQFLQSRTWPNPSRLREFRRDLARWGALKGGFARPGTSLEKLGGQTRFWPGREWFQATNPENGSPSGGKPNSGRKPPIVLFTGRLMHQLWHHFFWPKITGSALIRGTSPFSREDFARFMSGKKESGRLVTHPSLSVWVDNRKSMAPHCLPLDREGLPAAKNCLIRDGRLQTPVCGRKYATLLDIDPVQFAMGNESILFRQQATGPGPSSPGKGPLWNYLKKGPSRGFWLLDQPLGLHTLDPASGHLALTFPEALVFRSGRYQAKRRVLLNTNFFDLIKREPNFIRDPGGKFTIQYPLKQDEVRLA